MQSSRIHAFFKKLRSPYIHYFRSWAPCAANSVAAALPQDYFATFIIVFFTRLPYFRLVLHFLTLWALRSANSVVVALRKDYFATFIFDLFARLSYLRFLLFFLTTSYLIYVFYLFRGFSWTFWIFSMDLIRKRYFFRSRPLAGVAWRRISSINVVIFCTKYYSR